MKLLITITFHYDEAKLYYLKRVLDSIEKITTDKTKVVISVNDINDDECNTILLLNEKLDIQLNTVRRLYHPFFLAWAHKHYMIEFMDDENFTHFIYLEDDIEITPITIDYWVKTRKLFKKYNLNFLPAIVRVEYDSNGNIYVVDSIQSNYINNSPIVNVEDKKFISIERPYQAMFIMDRELVKEHIMSRSFRYETAMPFNGCWLVQDLASQGNMFENIPDGFDHRMLLPLQDFDDCLVHHNTDTYVNITDSIHSKLPVNLLVI